MGFSWTTFVFELVNFIVFLWLLQRMLYRPLQRAISDRRDKREQAERQLLELQEQGEELKRQQEQTRQALARERELVVAEARAQAQKERATILHRTDDELADLRRREREKLARERKEAQLETARESLESGRASAESLLRSLASDDVEEAMLRRLLDAIDPTSPLETATEGRAQLDCATALDDAKLQRLEGELAKRLGAPISLQVNVEPSLIAGLRLRVGDTVYDASLKAQFDRVVAQARRQLGLDGDVQTSGIGAGA